MEVNKAHIRHCMLFCFNQHKTAAEANRIICATYGESVVSARTCEKWFRRFKDGDFELDDKPRCGRPKESTEDDLQALLDQNTAQSTRELAMQLGVSQTSVVNRLKQMGKIQKFGKWVPHELSERALGSRLNICLSLLAKQKKKSFLWRIVTGDEKWIFYDNPKRQKHWVNPGQPTTSTPQRNIRDHKLLLCIWWDQEGIVYYELLPPGQTITGDRYSKQIRQLNRELIKKRPQIAANRRKVILLHDNARPHVAKESKEALLDLEWEVLPHPAYSPDIAPSDYHLFRSMQHGLSGERFSNAEEVRKWIDHWIASKSDTFFMRGIRMLPERWQKVVNADGAYFD